MTEGLGDFFKLVAESKQESAVRKKEEERELLEQKQREEEEFNKLFGDMSLDSFFEELGVQPKKERAHKETVQIVKEEEQKREDFDKLVNSIISPQNFQEESSVTPIDIESIYPKKVEKPKEVITEASGPSKQEKVLTFLESFLTQKIDDIQEIKEEIIEETPSVIDQTESLMERSLGLLSEPSDKVGVDQNFVTLDQLQAHYKSFLGKIQQQLSTLGGGGEVRLEFLDDIDRDTAKVDGKFLKYEASSGKWVGATGGGGGGGINVVGSAGSMIQHNGTEFVGVSSVGMGTFFNDLHQGYYRYSTHYYSVGTANTVQALPADEFVLVQPSVRTNKTDFMPQKMLDANNGNPWIGAGATIGTGQTTFSLAGLDEGSTVLVRIASQFNPDVDNTNLDFKLEFTTNPTTQSFGTTSFGITREQALICNEGAEQSYISETLMNFYVGSSLSGMTTETAGSFKICARASDEGDFEMLALTINVVA